MKLSPIPDLGARRRLIAAALLTSLVVAGLLLSRGTARLTFGLGDTDDALRLVMMRDLAHGQGWFASQVVRLQPPQGVYMHWSRLIDGGLAGLDRLLGLFLTPAQAEMGARIVWPLLWILPVTAGAMLAARRLGGGKAVLVAGVWAAGSLSLFHQFAPGRIDHHNAQIALCLLAFGAALAGPRGGSPAPWLAALAGLTSALGLAIGLEALPFHILIAAFAGLSWALGLWNRRALTAYGGALGLGALALHGLQTPPWRWTLDACDALALNLVAALVVAGAVLAGSAWIGKRLGMVGRLALLAAGGAATLAVYVALDPACVRGPLGLDAALTTAWLNNVQEMTPWPRLLRTEPGSALRYGLAAVLGLVAWAWLGRRRRSRSDPAWMLAGALLATAAAMTYGAIRMDSYLQWFSACLIAAALAQVGPRSLRGRLLPVLAATAALALLPPLLLAPIHGPRPPGPAALAVRKADAACTVVPAFHRLARLPKGLVLSEIDAGPYILAATPHAAVAAPYHRMAWGLNAALGVLGAEGAEAERRARALGVTYVVDCPAHAHLSDRTDKSANSLLRRLDRGDAPGWLEPLSAKGEALQVYRVVGRR